MHAISSYRGNRPTNTRRSPAVNPQTGPITIHRAAASLARSVNISRVGPLRLYCTVIFLQGVVTSGREVMLTSVFV